MGTRCTKMVGCAEFTAVFAVFPANYQLPTHPNLRKSSAAGDSALEKQRGSPLFFVIENCKDGAAAGSGLLKP